MPDAETDVVQRTRAEFYRRKLIERPLKGEPEAVVSPEAAVSLLRPWLRPGGRLACPRCGDDRLYELNGNRLRCRGCKYTFTEFTGRWINTGGLSASDWLFLVRLFVERYSAHQAAELAGLSYNAVYKTFTAIRFGLLAGALDGLSLFGPETGLGQHVRNRRLRGIPRKARLEASPVFGIMEQSGWAFADLMPGFQSETIFHFHLNFHLPLAKSGNIVYTGRYRQYETLVACVDSNSVVPVNRGAPKPEVRNNDFFFWNWARRRLKSYKGVTPNHFPLYLKEMEFRYNHRDQDLVPLVLERVCALVPELD